MKKTFTYLGINILFLATSLFLSNVLAQSTDFSIQKDLDAACGALKIQNIPTGILLDKTLSFIPITKFNGVYDTISNYKNLKQIYSQMKNAAYNRSKFISTDSLGKKPSDFYNLGAMPILILNYDYNVFKADALKDGFITVNNGKLNDNTGLGQSAYETKKVFLCTPFKTEIERGNFDFYFDASLVISNSNISISLVQADFGDNIGFRNVIFGEGYPVSYSSIGQKDIIIKITYSNGNVFQSKSQLNVTSVDNSAKTSSAPLRYWTANATQFNEGTPLAGLLQRGQTLITGRFGKDPITGLQHECLTNPLVFVEGIDFGQDHFLKNGDLGFTTVLSGGGSEYPQLAEAPIVFDKLYESGYDVMYVDFYDGADYIEKEAMILVNIIKNINNIKCSNQENIVIGASMGGQTARYALAYMEANNMKHCTREYISFDSPHKGANFPLGAQIMLNFFSDSNEDSKTAVANLARPGAQELLKIHYIGGENNPIRQHWLSQRDALGYPKKLRKTAIINGSANQTNQGYNAGDKLIAYYYDKLLWGLIKLQSDVYSNPGNLFDPAPYKYEIFHGRKVDQLNCTPACLIEEIHYSLHKGDSPSTDNAPGGQSDALIDFGGPVVNGGKEYGAIKILHPNFCFIPSISGLDINTEDYFFNTKVIDPNVPNPTLYPFDAYYANPNGENQLHVAITSGPGSNGEWLLQELLKGANNLPGVLANQVYNFGSVRKTISSINVNSGGILKVNGSGNTDFGVGQASINNSTFEVSTSDCGSDIIVNDNGQFILGENSPNNKAIVRIKSGSTIKIASKGKLIINDNSTLIIEPGATLIYEAGAQIQLLGENAFIDIQGTLDIGKNATFTFTYPNSTSGFIRFTQNPSFEIIADIDSRINLTGANVNDKLFDVIGNSNKAITGLVQFELKNGKVLIEKGSLSIDCPYRMTTTHFVGGGELIVWGSKYSLIGGAEFDGVPITAYLSVNIDDKHDNKLNMVYSTVKNTEIGITTVGGQVGLGHVTIDNCTVGWEAQGLDKPSTFRDGVITNCEDGIFNDFSAAELRITNCNIHNNDVGVFQNGNSLAISCGKINNNKTGIYVKEAILNMSTKIGNNGYVDASNNVLNIKLDNAKGLYLDYGYNKLFSSSRSVIEGRIYVVKNSCASFSRELIPASHNQWYVKNTQTNPTNYAITNYCSRFVTLQDIQQGADVCGSHDTPPGVLMVTVCPSCPVISTEGFTNTKFNDAVVYAMSKMELQDSTQNDLTAINLFRQILMTPIDSSNQDMLYFANIAFSAMNTALGNAFVMGRITPADNVTAFHPSVQDVLNVYDRFSAASTATNFTDQFYLDLRVGQLNRLAGRTDLAVEQFNSMNNCFLTPRELQTLDNWKIVAASENLVISGIVAQEQFDSLFKITPSILQNASNISSGAKLDNTALIGLSVNIGTGTVIEKGAIIGSNVTIGNNVVIKKDANIGSGSAIGNNTVIESNVILGLNNTVGQNAIIKKQIITGNDVTLGNNVQLEENVKLGGLVQIDANAKIAKDVQIADGSFIGINAIMDKSVKIGSNVVLGQRFSAIKNVVIGNASIIGNNVSIKENVQIGSDAVVSNNISIGKNAVIYDGATVTSNVADGKKVIPILIPNTLLSAQSVVPTLTPPSNPFGVTYDCSFASSRGQNIGNFFNGFTVQDVVPLQGDSGGNFYANSPIRFTPEKISGAYLWEFGDCEVSADKNAIHTYKRPGLYVVKLTQGGSTSGIQMCPLQTTIIGSIVISPDLDPYFIAQPVPSCSVNNKIVKFNKPPVISNLSAPLCQDTSGGCQAFYFIDSSLYRVKFNWNFGSSRLPLEEVFSFKELARNIDSNITVNYAKQGNYEVILTATLQTKSTLLNIWTNTSCVKTFKSSINTGINLLPNFELNPEACATDSTLITNQTIGGALPLSYKWKVDDIQVSTRINPNVLFGAEGIYSVKLVTSDGIGCKDSILQDVYLPNCPPPSITGVLYENPLCGGAPVANTTIVLIDVNKNIVPGVSPVLTGSDGSFKFKEEELTVLNPSDLFGFAIVGETQIVINSYKTISEWISQRPVQLGLYDRPLHSFTKVIQGEIVNDGVDDLSASWGDYDNDGDLDVFLFTHSSSSANPDALNYLLRNDCNNNFTRITNTSLTLLPGGAAVSTWLDADNDNDLDLLIIQQQSSTQLFINDGLGNFTARPLNMNFGTDYVYDISYADYDNDGYTDILISTEQRNYLYHNNHNLTFSSVDAGSLTNPAYSVCTAWGDYDNDGKMDIVKLGYRATATQEVNLLYHNEGNGNFTPVSLQALTSLNYGTYGASWIDYDNDGDLDLFVQVAFSSNLLFNNDGNGNFTKVDSAPVGSHLGQGGSAWGDYDNDGDLDLFLPNANFVPNEFYINNGDGSLTKNTTEPIVTDLTNVESIGSNWVDTDNDGDLDLYVTNGFDNINGDNNYFYYNNNGVGCNKWLKIKLEGVQSNKQGVGARVFIKAIINGKAVTQMREVNANSHLGGGGNGVFSNELHFGIGDATNISELKIVWPKSGIVQIFNNVALNNFYDVKETVNTLSIHSVCEQSYAKTDMAEKVNKKEKEIVVENKSISNNSINLYPNPNNGTMQIDYTIPENEFGQFEIFDLTGKKVISYPLKGGHNNFTISNSALENGIYLYRIISNEQLMKKDKLVIIK